VTAALPPLTLYVHVPWCVRKCPYCDFNSHRLIGPIPEGRFVEGLLQDLELDLPGAHGRPLIAIFIGGGTPSLLSGGILERLLSGIRERLDCTPDLEVTLEANPGTAEAGRFAGYRAAGVNRLSIGVQSFNHACLQALGRIHTGVEARHAVALARAAGFTNINLDLMFALPGQTLEGAARDLRVALELAPEHLCYYQLTLEPNTQFHHSPPVLPDEDLAWEMLSQGQALLATHGLDQYEVSAYARAGRRCRHNLNYWQFGDYLGIGPGAHGKLTGLDGGIRRTWKPRHPEEYLGRLPAGPFCAGSRWLNARDRLEELLLNALRLREGFSLSLFESRTGLGRECLGQGLARAQAAGLIRREGEWISATPMGFAFLNRLLLMLVES
jgi:putative oxygen-independent coproporphyrinogen III oxidase